MFLLAIRDVKSDAFVGMHVAVAKGAAIRQFGDAVQEEKSFLKQHPEDYQLFELASIDERSGRVTPVDVPVMLASASEFVLKKPEVVNDS